MMDYKAIGKPMASNLKLLSDSSSESVVSVIYHQMIGSLTLPDEHETRYLLCHEHIEPVPNRSETCSPDCRKAYSEVPEGYS